VTSEWEVLDSDTELFRRELDSFVPDRIFDAHAHLYDISQFSEEPPALVRSGPSHAGLETFRRQMDLIRPGRRCDGLFFAYPHAAISMDAANRFVAEEVATESASRAQMLIRPEMSDEVVFTTVQQLGFRDSSVTTFTPQNVRPSMLPFQATCPRSTSGSPMSSISR
jgi:hypothetical protein